MIVTALAAGTTNMVKDTATDALKATYAELIGTLRNRSGKTKTDELQDIAQTATDDKVTGWARLADALVGSGITAGDEVVAAARAVLAHADIQPGKYFVPIHDPQGVVVGDDTTVTLNFGTPDR